MKKMHKDTCPICLLQDIIELYPENINLNKLTFTYKFSPNTRKTFRVIRCKNCTHVFCSPVPKNMYKNYHDVTDREYLRHRKARILTSIEVLKTIGRYVSSGRLLDVGCATGDFLLVARDSGYVVEGMELSHWSSKITLRKNIKVYKERLQLLSRRFPNKYDIITMWGVIEHFEKPLEEMRYLNTLLKPGGILALWTGDVNGLPSRLLGRSWWYWQGQHIQYFTHKSLNKLAEVSGFEHLVTKRYPLATTYEQMQNSLRRYTFLRYVLPFFKLGFMIKPIWFLRIPGEMFWIAQKKA